LYFVQIVLWMYTEQKVVGLYCVTGAPLLRGNADLPPVTMFIHFLADASAGNRQTIKFYPNFTKMFTPRDYTSMFIPKMSLGPSP
jgi:hypothetical protein